MSGSWKEVPANKWPSGLIAVHMIHLHTGKVLIWAYGHEHGAPFHTPEAVVWDPTGGPSNPVAHEESNVFCSGHAGLQGGEVLYNEFGQTVNVRDWRK